MTALAGKTALVTGASRGIGRAIADLFEQEGAIVVRVARTTTGESATEARRKSGGHDRRIEIKCDITLESDVRRLADTVLGTVGAPDVLVNNAGAFLLKPAAETTAEEFQHQLDVNVMGGFLVLKAFLPAMTERGGHIVTIGSVADHVAFPGNAAYGASKYGLRGLHEALRAECAGKALRMTLISPGPTDTSLWDPVNPERRHDVPDRAGMLQATDVAEAVLFVVTRPERANVELLHLMPS
jgi:NADP-dependent 3-hydroxy acid dehydrogenase YdfG